MNILDLSNEILLYIFEKLDIIDVLYSLVDVNQRFDQIVFGLINVRHVNMVDLLNINSYSYSNYWIDPKVISKICDRVLFRIAHKICQLTIEQYFMKEILSNCIYSQLNSLTLVNCKEDILYENLQSKTLAFVCRKSKNLIHLFSLLKMI